MSKSIKLKDEFTIDGLVEDAHNLKDALSRLDEVVIDATNVKKTDIAALQMLIAAKKESRGKGKSLILRVSDEMSHLQELTGIKFDDC